MFKSIGKAISSAYSSVKSGISSALSAITGKTNTANAASASVFGSNAYNAKNVELGLQPASGPRSVYYNPSTPGAYTTSSGGYGNTGLNTSGGFGTTTYGPQLPVTISAGQQKVFSGGGSTPQLSLGSGGFLTSPVTISAKTLGAQTSGASGASLQSTGTSISNPVTLSSNPTSVNPTIDNTRLAGALSGFKQYNPKTGTFDDLATEPTKDKSTLADKVKAEMDILNKYMPEKQSVFDDPQVIEARNKRQQLQQALQVPTAELNAIIAKQNQDLLQLRQTGSQEGVTEAVYGGQQNAINYNAAIRALPLQASISAIQGDLKLAQDYLTELTQVKQEQINRQYEYNKAQFDAIKGIITKEDQRAYDEIKTQNDRAYKEQQDLIKVQSELLINALSNKAPQTVINRINNATSIQDAVVAAGNYGSKTTINKDGVLSTLPTSIQTKIISKADSIGSSDIGKKYNATVDSINIINGIDTASKNPADHQTIIYAFAKSLDPDSVVREGEYATIKKYAQSLVDRYGKEITNAIAGTGFLSQKAIDDIKSTMNNNYSSRKPQYDNLVKETKRVINNIAGKDVAGEIMVDYSAGVTGTQTNQPVIDRSNVEINGLQVRLPSGEYWNAPTLEALNKFKLKYGL